MREGFSTLDPERLQNGSCENLAAYRNQFSLASAVSRARPRPGDLVVDENYGLVYDDWVLDDTAVYGRSDGLAPGPLDTQATLGFLRVPFRRIPRISVTTVAEIESVLDRADEVL